jgi:hypothetical protein
MSAETPMPADTFATVLLSACQRAMEKQAAEDPECADQDFLLNMLDGGLDESEIVRATLVAHDLIRSIVIERMPELQPLFTVAGVGDDERLQSLRY